MKQVSVALAMALIVGLFTAVANGAVAAGDTSCSGQIRAVIDDAKDSYSAVCGVPYSDTSGFHRCDWVASGGWRCSGPEAETTPDQPNPTPSPPVEVLPSGAEGTITVRTLRELRAADIPEWAKADMLHDLDLLSQDGGGTSTVSSEAVFGRLSDAELDRQLDTAFGFDLAKIEETEKALADQGEVVLLCGGRWKDKSKTISKKIGGGSTDISVDKGKEINDRISAEIKAGGSIDGSMEFSAVIHYRERSNKCIGVPYRWDFKHADIDLTAEIDGGVDFDTTLTLRYQERLFELRKELIKGLKAELSIARVLTVRIEASLDLVLAIDAEAAISITVGASVEQDYDLAGRYEAHLRCTRNGCENREQPDWFINFTSVERPDYHRQVTVDLTLRPSAELQLNVDVHAGVLGIIEDRVFRGTLAIGVDVPVRFYWTKGNACSDADGDGVNEEVEGSLIEAKVRVYAYVKGRIGGQQSTSFINLKVPNGWLRKRFDDLRNVDGAAIGLEKSLGFKVLSEGSSSPLQPVVNHAGLFQYKGAEFEGVELGGVRDCYPFEDKPTILVDFDDSRTAFYAVGDEPLAIPHDWSDDGRNRTVRARVEFDSLGRSIKGPWVEVPIDANCNLPIELTTPVLRLGAGGGGPELQWDDNGAARGFNIYRDGSYIDTVRDATSWSLASEDGQQHEYHITAFDDTTDTYTSKSNTIVYGGSSGPSPSGDRVAVSMGDSYISGEGGRWLGNALSAGTAGTDRGRQSYIGGSDQNNCHRSDVAQIHSAGIGELIPINLACSGATTDHVRSTWFKGEPPQIEQLRSVAETNDVEMIVVSIGGNDLGFGDILADCMSDYVTGSGSCRDDGIYSDVVTEVVPRVRTTIEEIKAAMVASGDTSYRLVLQSYPSPVPRSSEIRYDSKSERVEGGCPFYSTDLDWARDTIVPILDAQYAALANELGIEFLSLRDAMQGKEVCASGVVRASNSQPATADGQEARLEWIRFGNPLVGGSQGELAELLHPNALGQRALGDCLGQVWDRSAMVHTCRRSGSGPSDMTVA